MHLFKSKTIVICAFSSLGLLSAATSGIGIAVSEGNIFINSSKAAGNATIFDGSTLETQSAASQVRLNGGALLRLASESRGTVFSDHVDLQKGTARIAGYAANANGLNVRADGSASATVSMRDQGVVEVAALTGSVHVFNAAGLNVANLVPGRALDLRPQDAGASAPSSITGCAVKSGNDVVMTDETSNVKVQLRGGNIKLGRHVQVTGSIVPNATPSGGASQVINVTSVKNVAGACAGASVPVATGIGTMQVVVAGTGAAAGVGLGAAAAAGDLGNGSNPTAQSTGRLGAFD